MREVDYYTNNNSRQLYLDTLIEFWEKLGSREFWGDDSKRGIALEALTQDYLRVEHGEYLEDDAISFQAAIDEYHRREFYILMQHSNP